MKVSPKFAQQEKLLNEEIRSEYPNLVEKIENFLETIPHETNALVSIVQKCIYRLPLEKRPPS
jgi:hypothetical protein